VRLTDRRTSVIMPARNGARFIADAIRSALSQLAINAEIDCAVGRLRLLMEHDAVSLPQLADMDGRLATNLSLCTALFRRRIIDLVGGFDEDMRFCEDTDYLLRLLERDYRVVLCEVDSFLYRRHSTNVTCDESGSQDGVMQLIRRRRVRMSQRDGGGR
jgi:GT2 family glycosyltransferase